MANAAPVVLLFQDDYVRVKKWVLSYPDSETGGQMFGLWTHDKNPHINVITGPGRNCRHGSHSFHQDIEYLKNVGTFLNKEFMMCHIGEWHSHHRLRLRQPSSGDLNSIWKHFPEGLEHFLLIIATIEDEHVRLNPWLFTATSHTYKSIEVKIIEKDNVFMRDEVVANTISSGAEMLGENRHRRSPTQMNTNQPGKNTSKTRSENKWYLTDWGTAFVQFLNSKLEDKVIDRSTNIDKQSRDECLQFSFQRNTCSVVLTFPQDFPKSPMTVECDAPGSNHPLELYIGMAPNQEVDEFVNQIVKMLREIVPKVIPPPSTNIDWYLYSGHFM